MPHTGRITMKFFHSGLVLTLMLALSACSSVPRIDKGPITAYGFGQSNTPPRYDSIRINMMGHPDDALPDACIQLSPTSEPIQIRQLTLEYVRNNLPKFIFPKYWPDIWRKKHEQLEEFQGNGYFISFEQGLLRFLSLTTYEIDPIVPKPRPAGPPSIGPANCNTLYVLPLVQEQFVEIFGQPDKVWRTHEVYY